MKKKLFKKGFSFSPNWLVVLIAVLFFGGIALAQIVNNYYGETTVNLSGESVGAPTLGAVTAVGGVCDGSEPATQLCNVNVYELESQSALTAAGIISSSGEGSKLGSANVYNPLYLGAGDGCSYILFTSSSTISSGATSTSFCN